MRSKFVSLCRRYRGGGPRAVAAAIYNFVRTRVSALKRAPKARRVNQWKQERTESERAYEHEPRVSFLIQWFNQRENVSSVAPRLPDSPAYETVVCEDGSVDGSLDAWDEHLTRRNDFLIRSNDLHEIRAYTRAAGLARGEYICLLQDDDTLPRESTWVEESLALFESNPQLAVICGQSGWGLQDLDSTYEFDLPDDRCHPDVNELLRSGGGYKDERPAEVPTVDPTVRRPFVFTPCISVGPVFIKRRVFEELGGFDLGFSEPGEPGMGFEVDFALRCWEAGYQVGFTPMGFDRGAVGGTETFEQQDRSQARKEAWEKLRADHRDQFDQISTRVHAANAGLAPREVTA
jgi:GT2 family glycosyltransferase